jgi:hypothetical protein
MNEPEKRDRANLLVLGVFLVIVIVGGFVMYLVKQNLALQRCEAERRMDCHAIAIPNSDPQPPPS